MTPARRHMLTLFMGLPVGLLAAPRRGHAAPDAPPNLIEINPRLTTSGQPSAQWLATLKAQGFDAVVYLAPSSASDAVAAEPEIVRGQGLAWHPIAIPFGKPEPAHVDQFLALMQSLSGKKVLVHCQVNMRASTMVFLHRVIQGGEAPEHAFDAVRQVWVPHGPWRTLMLDALQGHGIAFDPF